MIKLKKELSQILYDKLNGISDAHGLSITDIEDMLEYPPDSNMGDLALPCFKLSKALRMGPPMIAAAIGEGLTCEGVKEVSVAGGYLNFKLDDGFSARVLNKVLEMGDKYGSSDMGVGKTVVLDYSSPNVAKPFHIGHLGTTVIGHSIKKMHEFAGYKCIGVNHLGDWGTQFGKMIVAYRKWGDRAKIEEGGIDELVALYVKFHEEAEKDPELDNEARAEFTKLEHHDEENTEIWKWFIEISLKEYSKTYGQLGIEFDSYNGESFYFDMTPDVVKELGDKNLLTIDDGATIVNLDEYNMPPCLILKKDGSTIYHTRDIAAALYRKKTYDFEKCIYVTSAGQSLHFAQLFKVVELMGYEWAEKMIHVPYGTVSINGAKLATRTGNVILLKDLFALAIEKVAEIMQEKNPDLENKDDVAEAVGVGAIIFYYLSNSRIKDINFIMEDALSFEGNTGPYVQYTYARCCSILEKVGGFSADASLPEQFTCNEERELAKTLSLFEEKLLQAMREYEPSVIARYILDVCAAFNRFYHECHIATAPDEVTKALRVRLTAATKQTLGNAFDLICLRKPEKI